jgi:hypothetical protein
VLDIYDVPGAFSCGLQTVAGFEVWQQGPSLDPAPKLGELKGLGAVTVWFVSWPEPQVAVGDGMLTISELAILTKLVGTATEYHETLRRSGVVKKSTYVNNAKGILADGRKFSFHYANNKPSLPFNGYLQTSCYGHHDHRSASRAVIRRKRQ